MQQQNKLKIKPAIYARKSSEADDRQTLSIESQIEEGKNTAISFNIKLDIDNILSEAKSAKKDSYREIFEKLLKKIENGEINTIIVWHTNRLSGNDIDAARIIDLIDDGKLYQIITPRRIYKNTPDDKYDLLTACGRAKMENDNKSIDVKRGLRRKYAIGYPPCLAIIGYKNDGGQKGERKWLPDPERFNLVKQLFELFLSGKYSVRKLQQYADKILCLRTVRRRKEGGRPISISGMYNLLSNSIPAGFFYGKNEYEERERYELNETVPRMINEEQYWQIQTMLGKKGRCHQSKYHESFPYKEFLKCGNCDGSITAEHKHQVICPNCKNRIYISQ